MPHANEPILPGATLGMLGGGQLGRLFTVAARSMGYRVMVLDPDASSPAGQLADVHLCTEYDDPAAWTQLTQHCAAITTEFENISAEVLHALAVHRPVRPGADAVAVVQHRVSEKRWLQAQNIATAPFAVIGCMDDIAVAGSAVAFPAILKVARFGYDGKGQVRVANRAEVEAAFAELGGEICVLEQQISLQCELSVVLGRNVLGQTACFPVAENIHAQGILDVSIVPARVSPDLADLAQQMALSIAQSLHYCGVLGVEFFVTTEGELLVNELAPRPHNSGHFTIDACLTSQFELQVRALCNLPLGATSQHTPAVMVNLLGDLWGQSQPNWQALMQHPYAKLHLYGKLAARSGRKMGHYTCLADTVDEALALAQTIRRALPAVADSLRI